jgi:hypothetical protein
MRTLTEVFGSLEVFRPFMIPPPEVVQGVPYAPHPNHLPKPNKDEDSYTWGESCFDLRLGVDPAELIC